MTDVSSFNLDDLDLEPGVVSQAAEGQTLTPALGLDDIRARVMADQPITLDEEQALLHSIRRGYSMQVTEASRKVKTTRSSDGGAPGRRLAASATKGSRLKASEQLAALGGLGALDAL